MGDDINIRCFIETVIATGGLYDNNLHSHRNNITIMAFVPILFSVVVICTIPSSEIHVAAIERKELETGTSDGMLDHELC